MSDFSPVKAQVRAYYAETLAKHGPTPQGVDWNSQESQEVRFEQLLKLCLPGQDFTLNDLGCGYGALYGYLKDKGVRCQYRGYDLSPEMVETAQKIHANDPWCTLIRGDQLQPADYTVASGIFNVRQEVPDQAWQAYILTVASQMLEASRLGMAFNVLTSYSDPEYRKDYLFYADPNEFFDYAKRHWSRHVALLHDYGLYEFTLIVRREPV